jgi:uracil-DNA glycosylase family 4
MSESAEVEELRRIAGSIAESLRRQRSLRGRYVAVAEPGAAERAVAALEDGPAITPRREGAAPQPAVATSPRVETGRPAAAPQAPPVAVATGVVASPPSGAFPVTPRTERSIDEASVGVAMAELARRPSAPIVGATPPGTRESLDAVRTALGDCRRCGLCQTRRSLVFGVGNPSARLMLIGEAPGAEEDAQNMPFVGPAGQLLTRMLAAMGLGREDVYIANVIKCRPPDNRNPHPDEIAMCEPFLVRQIGAVNPEVIVTLGRFAAQSLLRREVSILRIRGQWQRELDRDIMPTLHPSYLLRNPSSKREVWDDLQAVMKRLDLEPPPRPRQQE